MLLLRLFPLEKIIHAGRWNLRHPRIHADVCLNRRYVVFYLLMYVKNMCAYITSNSLAAVFEGLVKMMRK